jgi:hypothetical protein
MADGTSRIRRGPAAVEAAIEEFELRERLDEPDASGARPGTYDLRWAHERIDAARRAADADVITAEEALEWLASAIGRELPSTYADEDDYDRE